ncbi:MAG: hypothetical protein J5746_13155 [Victivallales bacterium]|nr:hypothetical protein [Victivallales bacterium]
MLTGKYVIAAELALIAFMTVPKAWFGFPLALGTPNPYTTVLRAVVLSLHFMTLSKIAGAIGAKTGVAALLMITGIGFYNLGTLLAGFIYARLDNGNDSDSYWCVIVAGYRDTRMA